MTCKQMSTMTWDFKTIVIVWNAVWCLFNTSDWSLGLDQTFMMEKTTSCFTCGVSLHGYFNIIYKCHMYISYMSSSNYMLHVWLRFKACTMIMYVLHYPSNRVCAHVYVSCPPLPKKKKKTKFKDVIKILVIFLIFFLSHPTWYVHKYFL